MRHRAIAAALFAAVLTTACASYQDRVLYQTERLPNISVPALAGQSIAIDLRDAFDRPVIKRGFLHDDIEGVLQRAGMKVDDRAPLVLRIRQHYLGVEFRSGRHQTCGHYEGMLVRDGAVLGQPFSARACVEGTPNPWDSGQSIATGANANESGNRAYFVVLGELLRRFEQVAGSLPRA